MQCSATCSSMRTLRQPVVARLSRSNNSSGRDAPAPRGLAALPRRSLQQRQQQPLTQCSLTSHPGEVRRAAAPGSGPGHAARGLSEDKRWQRA